MTGPVDGYQKIVEIVDPDDAAPAEGADDDAGLGPDDRAEGPQGQAAACDVSPGDEKQENIDPGILRDCAQLDHSDTDNGIRLRKHFGADLAVLETEGSRDHDFVVWLGNHWDAASGNDAAQRVAQKVGERILLEAAHIDYSPAERAAVEQGEAYRGVSTKELTPEQRLLLAEANAARTALKARRSSRRKFGVTSKNQGRIGAMLSTAAVHLTKKPETFDRDPLAVATPGHTLRFTREVDAECPDPDVTRYVWRVDAQPGHRREDYLTKLLPVDYDPAATCPKWDAFLAEFLPVDEVRDFVRVFCGLGLTGKPIQKVLFHYGKGANGKSVFLETLTRVLGPLAVGLPAESLIGDQQRQGQNASPDLARLRGARFVRVLELPEGEPVREALLKKLTGGEMIPVRNLFKGFFEFQPVFKAHMSGNGYPRIDGTDNGIWRRLAVVHWPVTLEEARQRNFEDVVGDFSGEHAGILNWLISGAVDFLTHGLVTPEAVAAATGEYRDEMDPVGQFIRDCVEYPCARAPDRPETPLFHVTAREMYQAYVAWSEANAKYPIKEARFGRVMAAKIPRNNGRIRTYDDCRLHDVPERVGGRREEGE